jgi:tryptophan halogenase
MFHPASWLAIYDGFGVFPDDYDPSVDAMEPAYLARSLRDMRDNIRRLVDQTPEHAQFLNALDRAPTP